MSSTDHRIITREEGYFKLIEWERDQRVNADQIQLYVVTYCEGRSLFGMGIAPYSEEQLEEFKEIARAIKCQ